MERHKKQKRFDIKGTKLDSRYRIGDIIHRKTFVQTNIVKDRIDPSIPLMIKVSENRSAIEKEIEIVNEIYDGTNFSIVH